jgi:transcriptional regulator with XRE-family HTH domain
MDIPTLLADLGSTPSATARATGLARSTIQRMRAGVTSPTLESLRELALAAGYDLEVGLVPASDPAAAIAARVLVDPATPELDGLESVGVVDAAEVAEVARWVSRLQRLAGDDPAQLALLAGRYSAPQHRKGARFFAPKPGIAQERIIDIANGALGGILGALSGTAAARAYLGHAPDPGPVVAWTIAVDAVADRLAATLLEVEEFQPAGVLVAPTMRPYFVDLMPAGAGHRKIVAPIQAVIDLYGLGYDGLATEITEGW